MDEPDAPELRAVEYVLGTLPLDEREAVRRALPTDPALAAAVQQWEERLAPLADRVPAHPVPEHLWARIDSVTGGGSAPGQAGIVSLDMIRMSRSLRRWRIATGVAAALAASLALTIGLDRLRPGPAPQPGLVAVVNRTGELPALIVRVDPAAGLVQVRSLSAETPAGRTLELWSIVGNAAPRSLGTLAPGASRVSVPDTDRPRLEGATLAVSVEPPGGSPTGSPTGPVVYSGKLVPERD